MERNTLIKRLEELGYPLMEKSVDANDVLAEVVKSKDKRLWQGFPVILANMINSKSFDYHKVLSFFNDHEDVDYFKKLFIMSIVLFESQEIDLATWADRNVTYLQEDFDLKVKIIKSLLEGKSIFGLEKALYWENVKNTFKNYYTHFSDLNIRNYLIDKDISDLEFALSQVFPKRQKELLKKKIRGEKLSKTEREYYSRIVRKKLIALANSDLHKLALKLTKE